MLFSYTGKPGVFSMQIPDQRRITRWLPVYLALSSLANETLAQQTETTHLNHRDSNQLEEVLVTATRRVADVQTVPLGISVLTSEDLEIMGASGFADYARSVSGLSFTDGGTGGEKQTIRGVSTDIWSDFNAVTALYLDEVPLTHASGGIGPPFTPDPILVDIERIEARHAVAPVPARWVAQSALFQTRPIWRRARR